MLLDQKKTNCLKPNCETVVDIENTRDILLLGDQNSRTGRGKISELWAIMGRTPQATMEKESDIHKQDNFKIINEYLKHTNIHKFI